MLDNIEKAATLVCRNPIHLEQVKNILKASLEQNEKLGVSDDKMVEHWWKNQLFLKIDL